MSDIIERIKQETEQAVIKTSDEFLPMSELIPDALAELDSWQPYDPINIPRPIYDFLFSRQSFIVGGPGITEEFTNILTHDIRKYPALVGGYMDLLLPAEAVTVSTEGDIVTIQLNANYEHIADAQQDFEQFINIFKDILPRLKNFIDTNLSRKGLVQLIDIKKNFDTNSNIRINIHPDILATQDELIMINTLVLNATNPEVGATQITVSVDEASPFRTYKISDNGSAETWELLKDKMKAAFEQGFRNPTEKWPNNERGAQMVAYIIGQLVAKTKDSSDTRTADQFFSQHLKFNVVKNEDGIVQEKILIISFPIQEGANIQTIAA